MRLFPILLVLAAANAFGQPQKKPDQQVRKHVLKAVKGLLKEHGAADQERSRLVGVLDCVEERIEQHNRLQPSTPWADIKDIRRAVGGNPPKNKNLSACPAIIRQLKSFFPTGR